MQKGYKFQGLLGIWLREDVAGANYEQQQKTTQNLRRDVYRVKTGQRVRVGKGRSHIG